MDEWQRAIAFMRAIDQRCAEEVVPFRWGRALINRTLSSAPDLNYLLADSELESATADELEAESERIQGPTGISYRRVNVDNQHAADRLLPEFRRIAFRPERFAVMARHRMPDRQVDPRGVSKVDWAGYEPGRRREIESWAPTKLIAEQAIAKQLMTAAVVETSYWCAFVEASPASFCEVRREGSAAQIEFVETLAPFRRRGLARQLLTAVLESLRGCSFTFLVADLFDWPQHFYERLGFQRVGVETRFIRQPVETELPGGRAG